MKAQTIAALFLLSTTDLASVGDGPRPREQVEPFVHYLDPCVLTRTPEILCRRFALINYGGGLVDRIRVVLSIEQRAEADAYWERPENRWRRFR